MIRQRRRSIRHRMIERTELSQLPHQDRVKGATSISKQTSAHDELADGQGHKGEPYAQSFTGGFIQRNDR